MGKKIVVPIRYVVVVDVDEYSKYEGVPVSEVREDAKRRFGFIESGQEGFLSVFPSVEGYVTLVED